MNNDFEPVMVGLERFLKGKLTAFKTLDRRVQPWGEVASQPALFLRQVGVDDVSHNNIYLVTTLDVEIWIYAQGGADKNIPGAILLNKLIKDVRNCFVPDDPRGVFTIGGLAFWCRVEGRTEIDTGDLDAQGKALMRLKITLP